MKKPRAHWIGLGAWFAIVAAAVAACSGGTGAGVSTRAAMPAATAAQQR